MLAACRRRIYEVRVAISLEHASRDVLTDLGCAVLWALLPDLR